jgi:site-specific recombinase XerD
MPIWKQAIGYARAEKASATRRAYHTDFNLFEPWCAEKRVAALPAEPETVAAFLAFEANRGIRPSTITRRAASIPLIS